MIKINDNFCQLSPNYLFSEVARKIADYTHAHPDADIIRMGIGDVTRPVCQAAIEAMHRAVDDQRSAATFHGYGPEQGYRFLSEKIAEWDYRRRGVAMEPDEIFVGDGAKSDIGNIGDIFAADAVVAVTDPVYPVYVDTNVMAGRAGRCQADGRWSRIIYLPCTADNGFVPSLPESTPDIIYLCYPNNPTGTTLTRDQLATWVAYAQEHGAVILFDSAYEAFVTDADVPHSIYEIPGAREVAIEFRSFSKTAGFTGLRCGYTVIPKELYGTGSDGRKVSLNALWRRRQCTKFNGASYPVQRGAEAVYTDEGQAQIAATIRYYLDNAALLVTGLAEAGLEVFGGRNAPYVWVRTPGGMGSWEFFDRMIDRCHVVCTPGVGFGPSGEGYVRLTAFNTRANTEAAVERFRTIGL